MEPGSPVLPTPAPLLEAGDRLSRDEFERRYERMPHVKKAELVEGTVYLPSPIRAKNHAGPHNCLGTWLGVYVSETSGAACFDNSTVRLDLDNEPQPDLVLLKLMASGGQARISNDDYIEGAPELVVEVLSPANTRAERAEKLKDYESLGVPEVWVVSPEARSVEVLSLRDGRLSTTALLREGQIKPAHLPGVTIDIDAIWPK